MEYKAFKNQALDVVALNGDEIAASTYSGYKDSIETEIDMREDHRRKGLAQACGARLILECLKRNLYLRWDIISIMNIYHMK